MPDDRFQQLGPRTSNQGVVDVASECAAKSRDRIVGNFVPIAQRFRAPLLDTPDRREQRNRVPVAVVRLGRREEPHLNVVPEHTSVQSDDSLGEDRDIGVFLCVPPELPVFRRFRGVGVPEFSTGNCGAGSAAPDHHGVLAGDAQVVGSLGRHWRHHFPKTVGDVLPRDPTGRVR